jgi:hypothetical protein
MALHARPQVVVERLGGRHEHDRAAVAPSDLDGERRLPAPGAADQEGESRHPRQ